MKKNITTHELANLLLECGNVPVKLKTWNHDCCDSWQENIDTLKFYVEEGVFIIEEEL